MNFDRLLLRPLQLCKERHFPAFRVCTTREGEVTSLHAPPRTNSTRKTSFTKSDFKKIQWLEGAWRGSGGGVEPFFERYHFTNDTTIEIEFFSDAGLQNLTKKETIVLVDGEIRYRKSTATRHDDKSIEFESKEYYFSWETESADVWIARLYSPTLEGRKLTRGKNIELGDRSFHRRLRKRRRSSNQ